MKAKSFFIQGTIMFILAVLLPVGVLKFGIDPQNPDIAEMGSFCLAIPLVVLSFLFALVGITHLINERSVNNTPKITPPE